MKYVHGIDEKVHDLIWVWENRIGFVVGAVSILLVFPILIYYFDWYLVLFCGFPIFAMSLFLLYGGLWNNARYCIDEQGITFATLVSSKQYPWNTIKKVFVHPDHRSFRGYPRKAYDYIVLMISESRENAMRIDRQKCWLYLSDFLIVRSTERRIQEFKKYCFISDPPGDINFSAIKTCSLKQSDGSYVKDVFGKRVKYKGADTRSGWRVQ